MTMLTTNPPAAPLAVPHSRAMPATSRASNHVVDPAQFSRNQSKRAATQDRHGASSSRRAARPTYVLAVEGASFIEKDAGRVKAAYELGVRHLQLVHYTSNTIGEIQTEPPEHQGLTQLGRQIAPNATASGFSSTSRTARRRPRAMRSLLRVYRLSGRTAR